jgi:site-specific DNA-methyltransferase (adenine-specific)
VHELAAQFYPADVAWSHVYRCVQMVPGEKRPSARVRARGTLQHRGKIGAGGYEFGPQRMMRSVIWARSCHGRAANPTQKPEAILAPFVRYSCPPGGVVLDPFCGSGSTGLACQLAGVDFVGIEIRPDEAVMARRRLAGDVRGDAPLLAGGIT